MTRQLGKNLRKGHLAEDVGISFLRNFCAVAHIRQEDDIGIDAVATLLRASKNLLIAEESFLVQIKAASVREIEYKREEAEWILQQELPLFILSVDHRKGELEMYTTNPVFGLIPYIDEVENLVLDLDNEGELVVHSRLKRDGKKAIVALAPPVFEINEIDARDDTNVEKLYELIKSWVSNELNQIGFRKLKKSRLAEWKTWTPPKYTADVTSGSSNNIQKDMEIIAPYLEYLSLHVFWDQGKHRAASAFLELQEWFEEHGVEIDVNEDQLENKVI